MLVSGPQQSRGIEEEMSAQLSSSLPKDIEMDEC